MSVGPGVSRSTRRLWGVAWSGAAWAAVDADEEAVVVRRGRPEAVRSPTNLAPEVRAARYLRSGRAEILRGCLSAEINPIHGLPVVGINIGDYGCEVQAHQSADGMRSIF